MTSGSRCDPSGSSRHSSTLRSTTSAPGSSPSSARWAAGRMSTMSPPAAATAASSSGAVRSMRRRARRPGRRPKGSRRVVVAGDVEGADRRHLLGPRPPPSRPPGRARSSAWRSSSGSVDVHAHCRLVAVVVEVVHVAGAEASVPPASMWWVPTSAIPRVVGCDGGLGEGAARLPPPHRATRRGRGARCRRPGASAMAQASNRSVTASSTQVRSVTPCSSADGRRRRRRTPRRWPGDRRRRPGRWERAPVPAGRPAERWGDEAWSRSAAGPG